MNMLLKKKVDGGVSLGFRAPVGENEKGVMFFEMDADGARIIEEMSQTPSMTGDEAIEFAEKYFDKEDIDFDFEHIQGQIAYFNALSNDEKLLVIPESIAIDMAAHDERIEGAYEAIVSEHDLNFSVITNEECEQVRSFDSSVQGRSFDM